MKNYQRNSFKRNTLIDYIIKESEVSNEEDEEIPQSLSQDTTLQTNFSFQDRDTKVNPLQLNIQNEREQEIMKKYLVKQDCTKKKRTRTFQNQLKKKALYFFPDSHSFEEFSQEKEEKNKDQHQKNKAIKIKQMNAEKILSESYQYHNGIKKQYILNNNFKSFEFYKGDVQYYKEKQRFTIESKLRTGKYKEK